MSTLLRRPVWSRSRKRHYEDVGVSQMALPAGRSVQRGSKHTKLYYKGRQSTLPRHQKEIGEGLRLDILKQLGLK